MKIVAKRDFLLRQEDVEGGKKKPVYAKKGVLTEVTEKEAIAFWGSLDIKDHDKKRLLAIAKQNGYRRRV
jgi:hypothetical protein